LPVAQREAVTMAYFGGCSYREVAERLGIPEGTAKSRMRMALSRLAQLLHTESPLT
jgi:RNA polymerase sigma-70 factor (ECF subfamily)